MASPDDLDALWRTAIDDESADAADAAARSKAEPPGVTIRGEETEITSPVTTALIAPEELLRRHGMDPAEWEILEAKTGQWDASAKNKLTQSIITTTLHQMRVRARPKKAPRWIVPASGSSAIIRPKPMVPSPGKTRLTLVTTDLQVPFHDPHLHELSLRLAEIIQPDEWVDLGDVLDLPSLSKYRKKPEFHATLQESVNVGGQVFAERSQAVPKAKRRVLWGNHDARLRIWLLEHAEELFGLTRAQIGFEDDERSVLDLDYLLRLDELGWEKARSPWGEYPYETIWIAPGLAGIHGSHVRKGAGNSVRQELHERTHSVISGHVNKLACYAYTRTDVDKPRTVFGVEAGLMCLVAGSLGFGGQTADWTNGLVTVTTFDDGAFTIDLAPYTDGCLRWRNVRLSHDARGNVKVDA